MVRGINISATGLVNITDYHDIIANNLANVNTPGFKQTLASFKSLDDIEVNKIDAAKGFDNKQSLGTISAGGVIDSTVFDFSQGSIKPTGNPFDLAISGEGFFVVNTPNGEAYTRNGSFITGEDGLVTTLNGHPLVGESGPISININEADVKSIKIHPNGDVEINKEIVDKVKIVDFEDRKMLKAMGDSLFKPVDDSQKPIDSENYQINQGALESSNANVVECMIKSIEAMRAYENLTKNIETVNRGLSKTINEVGRIKR
ncbi:MAG: flagellar basal-body rod protein FlgF [Candidatus Melainabacteria bacterium RIFOXYA2_FULL_32_9]|nr:MAG: flagellar basal-body rod protein FlgF [Candidatus Melainabacteria bacterium RIFOXYA2_FULL_32_9]